MQNQCLQVSDFVAKVFNHLGADVEVHVFSIQQILTIKALNQLSPLTLKLHSHHECAHMGGIFIPHGVKRRVEVLDCNFFLK